MKTKGWIVLGLALLGLSLVFTVQVIGRPTSASAESDIQDYTGAVRLAPDAPTGDGLTLSWMSEEWDATHTVAWADYDNDGDLDLLAGNRGQPSRIYKNNRTSWGEPSLSLAWTSPMTHNTYSAAWGDYDGDGYADAAFANQGYNRVYRNNYGGQLELAWTAPVTTNARSVAWGDYDGDGDLDLAFGNEGSPNQLYRNDDNSAFSMAWTAPFTESTQSVAWGDYDGDGDLDLMAGNADQPNRLYRNDGGALASVWTAPFTETTHGGAWGDCDGDGDLDLAVGNVGQPSRVYRNDNGAFTSVWVSPMADTTRSVAWGDYEGDGDLDLIVGNEEQPNRLYRNDGAVGGIPILTLAWSASLVHDTHSIAWGDVDNDGDLDLALGNPTQPNLVYLNSSVPALTLMSSTLITNTIYAVAWVDYDRDGDLDLSAGHVGGHSLYRNDAGTLTQAWTDATAKDTRSVAWGDIDGDGDLDLAIGNSAVGGTNWVYLNNSPANGSGQAVFTRIWTDPVGQPAASVIWGDYDGDGDLDLGIGGASSPVRLYRNDGGALALTWTAPVTETTRSIAWGDYDRDGDLDLALGNDGQRNRIYRNDSIPGSAATFTSAWLSTETDNTWSLAWGDYDRDGDLDLMAGNRGQPNRLYRNYTAPGGTPSFSLSWSASTVQDTRNVAWGDYDGDGNLDLAVGNEGGYNQIYRNSGNALALAWTAPGTSQTSSVAWGDFDSDGDLDLIAGVSPAAYGVYSRGRTGFPAQPNTPPQVSLTAIRPLLNANFAYTDSRISALTVPITYTLLDAEGDPVREIVAQYSLDGGGRWYDAGSAWGNFTPRRYWKAANATPRTLAANGVVTSGVWLTPTNESNATDVNVWVALSFPAGARLDVVLESPEGAATTLLDGQYFPGAINQTLRFDHIALRGGAMTGRWRLRVENHSGVSGTLRAWGLQVQDDQGVYTFTWDISSDRFFGQSNNLVFRMTAYASSGGGNANATPLYQQRPYATTISAPIRVRGMQVRVYNGAATLDNAVAGAQLYRLPAGQTTGAELLYDENYYTWRTNNLGHLQGRGTIQEGDQLIALAPIRQSDKYTLYYTNAAPTPTGLDISSVNEPGLRTLIASAANPLILFNLDVSLEWNARVDTAFLGQLKFDLQRASEVLYDATNGQAALGNLTLYHNKQHWDTAAIQIHASNALVPNADVGGVVTETTQRAITVNPYALSGSLPYTITYLPGAVRIGTVWGRYGEAGGVPGEDWPRALVHELGHYLFYLYDNYVGQNNAGDLIPVSTCSGSLMGNPYEENEYRTDTEWAADCGQTLSARRNGAADWETIAAFYPALETDAWAGPFVLPLKVTQISEVTSYEDLLPVFMVSLTDLYGASLQPGPHAQAILYQGNRVIDLGHPEINVVTARGARAGDRLCVYELNAQPPRWGCETLEVGDTSLALVPRTDWQPEILVTPWDKTTVSITVTNVAPGLRMMGQVYPSNGQAGAAQQLTEAGDGYTATFTLPTPDTQALVQIWAADPDNIETAPRREAITSYAIGGSAACPPRCSTPGGPGLRLQSEEAVCAATGENFRPAVSPDGQVLLYADFTATEGFYTLQKATRLPEPLPWATVIGAGYHVLQTPNAVPLTGTASINFRYRRQDVPPGEESFLALYYWTGSTWTKLPTLRHPDYNEVTAPAQGPGLYALMSSLEIRLPFPGWNLMSYPVQAPRAVTDAMASIAGYYRMVYGYDPGDAADPWKLYAPALSGTATWVNDLHTLRFGQGYWISATQPITWELKGATTTMARQSPTLVAPPATYYGRLLAGPAFTPTVGMAVVASVAGKPCAQTTTRRVGTWLVYSLNVGYTEAVGMCGALGQTVTFTVDGQDVATAPWQNDFPAEVTLTTGHGFWHLYLPLVMK